MLKSDQMYFQEDNWQFPNRVYVSSRVVITGTFHFHHERMLEQKCPY